MDGILIRMTRMALTMMPLALICAPLFVLAQGGGDTGNDLGSLTGIRAFFRQIQLILNIVPPILVTLAVIVFFWGLVKYVYAAGNEKTRADGAALMTWGVIALFVMLSVWGLVAIIQSLFGVDRNAGIIVPSVPSI